MCRYIIKHPGDMSKECITSCDDQIWQWWQAYICIEGSCHRIWGMYRLFIVSLSSDFVQTQVPHADCEVPT